MALQAIATFIDIPGYGYYQNGKVGSSIVHDRIAYQYMSFLYQGAARSRSGDNLQATLVLANGHENQDIVPGTSKLITNIAKELITTYATVRVRNCLMDPANYNVIRVMTEEFWLASSMTYDPEVVEVVLASSLDAIGTQAPTRVLTRKLVGALPTTGAVQNL